MSQTGSGPALGGVNPQVRGASVRNDSELLAVRADSNLNEILSVHVVFDGDLLARGPSLGASHELFSLGHVVCDGKGVVVKGNSVS